jgi:uncharacterized protein (TIGR00251 family)
MTLPATAKPDGVVLHVRLTPKSSAARIAGAEDHGGKPVLKAYVTAPPEDGKANAALMALVADWLGVPKSTVSMAAGQKSRLKFVSVRGDAKTLLEKIAALLADASETAGAHKKKR